MIMLHELKTKARVRELVCGVEVVYSISRSLYIHYISIIYIHIYTLYIQINVLDMGCVLDNL